MLSTWLQCVPLKCDSFLGVVRNSNLIFSTFSARRHPLPWNMPGNGLTRVLSLQVGPVVLGTLFRHFLARREGKELLDEDESRIDLRRGELVYDQMFNVIKLFLETASLSVPRFRSAYAERAHVPVCQSHD